MPYQVEKTVFISYRRTNVFHARAIFQNLHANGYDVFMDYESIDSGAFDQIILNQIKARAHFLVLLTPSALERCSEPGDWLRREIETAIEEKRNIVPLYFEGFDFADVQKYLPIHLHILGTYNALRIPSDYFDEAMGRLRDRFLNKPLEMIIHPTPIAEKPIIEKKTAEQAAEPVVIEEKLTASEYFERAYQAVKAGNYDKAIRDYSEAIRLNPQYAYAYNNRGVAYRNLEQYEQAIADYDQAIQLDPQYASAYYNRGYAYDELKQYEQAIADYDQAIQLDPQVADAYNNRGVAYYNLKQYEQAIADYDKAIQLDPQYADAYYNRGSAYYDLKQYEQAIADYNKAIQLDLQNADAYNNRGSAYYMLNEYDLAIADYEAALKIDPTLENARKFLEISKQKARGE
ncbi:MAG: tetratricopeptide repeat protein [Anaerolineaceae bacterium]|nr:tetratricopeptide repeat protein [Anaerolineaceae bacterium]